jgi:hypothetical protein
MKREKARARKSEVMNLRNRITQVRKGIDFATKNESDSRQKLLSLSQSNTDSVGFIEFIELLNVLDKRKSQRSEIKSKISR